MSALTFDIPVHLGRGQRGRKRLRLGEALAEPKIEPGRVPRVSVLMALALHFDDLIRAGELESMSDIGRLGGVTPARVAQIMSLLQLAPDIQEAVLTLPRTMRGKDRIVEADLFAIAARHDWRAQRRMWLATETH